MVSDGRICVEREDLDLIGTGLGDPELVGRPDEADVVRARGKRHGGDDAAGGRVDDIELAGRAVGDVEEPVALVDRGRAVIVIARVAGDRSEARDRSDGQGVGIDEVQRARSARRDQETMERGRITEVVEADAGRAVGKRHALSGGRRGARRSQQHDREP